MGRLSQRSTARLLAFIRGLYVLRDRERFISHLLSALPTVIPADVASFNEAEPVTHRSRTWMNPTDPLTPENIRTWNALMHEHPYVAHQTRSPHPRPVVRVSDLAPRSDFARTAVYNELLYPLGLEEQLLMAFPSHRMSVSGAGLYRHRRGFSEEESFMVSILHPHLLQAHDNAERLTKVLDDLRALERGVVELQRGLVYLTPEGTVWLATAVARTWLHAYFPGRSAGSERLPDTLHRWVVEHLRCLDGPAADREGEEPTFGDSARAGSIRAFAAPARGGGRARGQASRVIGAEPARGGGAGLGGRGQNQPGNRPNPQSVTANGADLCRPDLSETGSGDADRGCCHGLCDHDRIAAVTRSCLIQLARE